MNSENSTEEEKTAGQELREMISEKAIEFMKWLSFNDAEPWYLNTLRLLYKIPVALIVLIFSPILLIIVAITFIIVI